MAVYQGARIHGGARRAADRPGSDLPARRARGTSSVTTGSVRRVRPAGVLMAGIAAATMLGLVYLTQTLGANATTTEIAELGGQHEVLMTEITRQQEWALRYTEMEKLAPRIKKQKLVRLDDAVVLRAP